MNFNVFPPVFDRQMESEKQQRISSENSRNTNDASRLASYKGKTPEMSMFVMLFSAIGAVIGFFACVSICINNDSGSPFGTFILCAIIGLIAGLIIGGIVKSSHKSSCDRIDSQIAQNSNTSRQSIAQINHDISRKQSEYKAAFEKRAQDESVQFAESDLAKEVIAWMTDGFCKTIDSADRRSHVERINVPFIFNVYKEKITCNLGTFDFELKRCRELRSPIEQTALARAIASKIQLNLIMKYPKDSSGTDISIALQYGYTDTSVTATITYVAPNGNYKVVKDW